MAAIDHSPTDESEKLRATLAETRKAFLQTIAAVRPRLHRFCARMCGSALDGEDVVQETLAQAFFALPTLEDPRRLEAWLFRIAHHKCVDFIRRDHRRREDTVAYEEEHANAEWSEPSTADDEPIDGALLALVGELPPKERAAVLLKDVLDYPLAGVADVIDSTVGGVKAALHRGRTKLQALREAPVLVAPAELDAHQRALFGAYAECFNRRDWDGLRRLVRADARLEIVGAAEGTMLDVGKNYMRNNGALSDDWRFAVSSVDGEPVVVRWRRVDGAWRPWTALRLWWDGDQVVRIRDYVHVEYLLRDARVEPAAER
jgi:RNA polymerase sigma-70 factor, ECF subfamily